LVPRFLLPLDGLEMVDHKLHGHPAQASLLHTLLAGIAYEFDEIGSAVDHIERAMSSIDEYGPADAVRDGAVAFIEFRCPERHNALDVETQRPSWSDAERSTAMTGCAPSSWPGRVRPLGWVETSTN